MSPMNSRLLRPLARFQAPAANPFATIVSTKSTGNVSGSASSTTGYIKVEWWDSTTNVFGTGVAGNSISWSKAAGGAGSKTALIYPSDVSGNLSGSLTVLDCSFNSLTSLDVNGCTALTVLNCQANSLTTLDVSGLTALTVLNCQANSLTSLDVSGLTALASLNCSSNSLTSLDVSGLTALASLNCTQNSLTTLDVSGLTALTVLDCFLTSLTTLDVNGCTALTVLNCQANSLTSLDVSGLTALTVLDCSSNSLTSLRAVGVVFDAGSYKTKKPYKALGVQLLDTNSLSAAALNQFYTDLGATTPGTGFLNVVGNPGTATHDPSIATNKGYVVFAS